MTEDGSLSATKPLRELAPDANYRPEEVALPGDFVDPYVGKQYPSGSTEAVSMGSARTCPVLEPGTRSAPGIDELDAEERGRLHDQLETILREWRAFRQTPLGRQQPVETLTPPLTKELQSELARVHALAEAMAAKLDAAQERDWDARVHAFAALIRRRGRSKRRSGWRRAPRR